MALSGFGLAFSGLGSALSGFGLACLGFTYFSTGWHDARFVAMTLWWIMKMKMIFFIDDMMVKMKMKMNGKMNEKMMVTWFDLKECYLHVV